MMAVKVRTQAQRDEYIASIRRPPAVLTRQRVPIPEEAWPVIRAVHSRTRLTYQQIGDALGYSGSRIKQVCLGQVAYKTASGGWSVRKEPGAVASESAEQSPAGPAAAGHLPGAES